uniref:Uncharacterized protein n=1 Tax=Tetraselmis chuii TaxID=63592 RepID=A0A7S1SJ47_9CHLO
MKKTIEKSAGELSSLLHSVDSNWREHTGLCKAVAPAKGNEPGATVWCLPELAPIVEEHGVTDDIMDILRERKRSGHTPSYGEAVPRQMLAGQGTAIAGTTSTGMNHDAPMLSEEVHQALNLPGSIPDPSHSAATARDEGPSSLVEGGTSGENGTDMDVWRVMTEAKEKMETQQAQHERQVEQLMTQIEKLAQTINQMSGQQGAKFCNIQ